jgi:hypothetical protein
VEDKYVSYVKRYEQSISLGLGASYKRISLQARLEAGYGTSVFYFLAGFRI